MMRVIVGIVLLSMVAAGVVLAAEKPASQPAATQPAPVNKKCPITGDAVDPKGKTVKYKGKVVGFCCDDCIDTFNKDPDKYADKLK